MRYQNCIFDLYGTLVDIHTDETRPALWRMMAAWYREYGADYAPEELRDAYFRTVRQLEAAPPPFVMTLMRPTQRSGLSWFSFGCTTACAIFRRAGRWALPRHVLVYFSVYEEIGHGTSWLPAGVQDILVIDIAPTGDCQNSDERKVTVFCKDSRYPYHREMTNELRAAAIRAGVDYVMDVFTPHYGSDGDTSIAAGWDVRHAAIGPDPTATAMNVPIWMR